MMTRSGLRSSTLTNASVTLAAVPTQVRSGSLSNAMASRSEKVVWSSTTRTVVIVRVADVLVFMSRYLLRNHVAVAHTNRKVMTVFEDI
jgi:hypothetical protein